MKTVYFAALMLAAATAIAQTKSERPRTEFSLTLSESVITLKPGESKQVMVNIARSKSYAKENAVLAQMSELPQGITIAYEPNEGNFETSTATITAATDAAAGSYSLVLSSTLNHRKKGAILKLVIDSPSLVAK